MGVDIAGDGVYFILHKGHFRFIGVLIFVQIQVQQRQKFYKFLVDDQIPHGIGFLRSTFILYHKEQ